MRVFLSWSGKRSQYVAELFDEWLPVIIQKADPFMSERGIEAGNRWLKTIDGELEATDFGVLFLTPENQNEPWLVHEAGALAKSVEESRVVPVAIDMEPADIDWPLARFQAVELDQDGIWDLLTSINSKLSTELEKDTLRKSFESNWSRLTDGLSDIPKPSKEDSGPTHKSSSLEVYSLEKKIDEAIELIRSISREREEVLEKSRDEIRKVEKEAKREIDKLEFEIRKERDKIKNLEEKVKELSGDESGQEESSKISPEDVETPSFPPEEDSKGNNSKDENILTP